MAILIADSGSTKTSWCLTDGENHQMFITQGINPYQQTEDEICYSLQSELMPEVRSAAAIYFYGAGCTRDKTPIVASALRRSLGTDIEIFVESDMLGSARALCGNNEGIVCILGTGSNSCYYDGRDIVNNVAPLGYVLGDEGSGAYIGKRLVGNCFKRQFSKTTCDLFFKEVNLSVSEITQRVYRNAFPNRFLASLSMFCGNHLDIPEIHDFVIDCFREFFVRNVALYEKSHILPIHFIGSIAWKYHNELHEVAQTLNYNIGNIEKSPIEKLIIYHDMKS